MQLKRRSHRTVGVGASYLLKAFFGLLLFFSFTANLSLVSAADNQQEYKLKAAFLYNFAKFVRWPDYALPPASEPITFCVTDLSLFPDQLASIARKQISKRALLIKEIAGTETLPREELKICQLLFVDEGSQGFIEKNKDSLRHVLTVGEKQGFHDKGGMIRFYQQNGKLRFSIHIGNANEGGISINSRLLRLAKVVGE